MNLPFRAEYSTSSRSVCRRCRSRIRLYNLRIAVMVQSPVFDGKTPNWYHHDCFFTKQIPKTVDDIAHFESLRYEDQELIRKNITTGVLSTVLKDFMVEYSKRSREVCRGCKEKIKKNEIQIYKNECGGHHVACFVKLRFELDYYECGDKLNGYEALNKADQAVIKKELPAIKQEDVSEKKLKVEDEVDTKNDEVENELKSQSKIMFGYRDKLQYLNKPELQLLLESYGQETQILHIHLRLVVHNISEES